MSLGKLSSAEQCCAVLTYPHMSQRAGKKRGQPLLRVSRPGAVANLARHRVSCDATRHGMARDAMAGTNSNNRHAVCCQQTTGGCSSLLRSTPEAQTVRCGEAT